MVKKTRGVPSGSYWERGSLVILGDVLSGGRVVALKLAPPLPNYLPLFSLGQLAFLFVLRHRHRQLAYSFRDFRRMKADWHAVLGTEDGWY